MERIKVLLIEPMEKPRLVEVEDTLKELQKLVGGSIAATFPWKEPVALVFNDNGLEECLRPNRVLEEYKDALAKLIYSIILENNLYIATKRFCKKPYRR